MSYTHYAQLVDSHHTEWQEHFNALLEHIKDPDDFDALILSDTDFEDQIKHVLSIKQPMLVQRAAIIRFLEGNLFTTTNLKEFMKDPIDFSAIFNIFLSAAQAGYLPDTVTLKGPSPGQTWTVITSPVKKVLQANKSHITKPILFQLPSSPTPTPTPTLSSPPYQPPILSTPYTPTPKADSPITHGQSDNFSTSLASFLENSSVSPSLPLSSNVGMDHHSLPKLPIMNNTFLPPMNQQIYNIARFIPRFNIDQNEKTLATNSKGEIVLRKPNNKVLTSEDWMTGIRGLAANMERDPLPHQFVWSEFLIYLDRVSSYFIIYTTPSVIAFDIYWRKWRRANKLSWHSSNDFIRELAVVTKNPSYHPSPNTSVNSPPKKKGAYPPGTVCHNFSRLNGCSRGAQCFGTHQCSRCNTTWKKTDPLCLCIKGSFPPSQVFPPGVTKGQ
jgi:hypothetical protein